MKVWKVGLLVALVMAACGEDDEQGAATFTTWGEEYIEDELGPDPTGEVGFVDGWTVKYEKFLVVFHAIEVATRSGKVGAKSDASFLVDNTIEGRKELVSFTGLEARHWDAVSYQVKPALTTTRIVAGTQEDLDLMVDNGYSLYVAGTASKVDGQGKPQAKTFRWGFRTATQYRQCQQAEESGQALQGIVVTNGGEDVSELTTHGDHLFYDRLMASPDPEVKTALRFDEKAAADADGDGEITFDELTAARIDVRLYDPSGLDAPNLGAFITSLSRTVGHFRGEGECSISAL